MPNAYTAWIVLLFGFIFTGAAWYTSDQFVQANARDRFENRANEISSAIYARMLEYEQVLRGGVAFFNASGFVDRKKFHSYVTALSVGKNLPGIQGFGFSVPVAAADKSKHIDDVRGEGFPKYTIKPAGDRNEYSAIIYLEPFDSRNRRAFGFDMWSNAMRREAMTRARDTGEASTSGIITLVQETKDDVQKGFLTYLPLYKNTVPLTTVENRRAAFMGWVYAPFRMGNLMTGILGSGQTEIEYEIFDGDRLTKDTLLFDSNKSFSRDNPTASGVITKTQKLEFQGRQWTLQFASGTSVLSASESRQPMMVALAGLTVDFLLFYIISSLALLQKRAEKLAREMTIEAREAEEKSSLILESAGDGICGLDKDGNATFLNAAGCKMLGYSVEELVGHPMRRLIQNTALDGTLNRAARHPRPYRKGPPSCERPRSALRIRTSIRTPQTYG